MTKEFLAAIALSLFAFNAHAATYNYTGTVTDSTDAFEILTPIGTPVGGYIEFQDAAIDGGFVNPTNFIDIGIAVGDFCFTYGVGTCTGTVIPIVSIDFAAITFDGLGQLTGGAFGVTAFSSTAQITLPIVFDLDADTFSVSAIGLGTIDGTGTLSPVPVPAAVWLLGSALLGLLGVSRRSQV